VVSKFQVDLFIDTNYKAIFTWRELCKVILGCGWHTGKDAGARESPSSPGVTPHTLPWSPLSCSSHPRETGHNYFILC